jgi:hypothetical protein
MGAGRTDHPATVEQKEGGPEPPGTRRGVLRHALSITLEMVCDHMSLSRFMV